jgi:hypothetical protein
MLTWAPKRAFVIRSCLLALLPRSLVFPVLLSPEMASEQLFEGIPPFPEDVPTATILPISLAKLNSGDDFTVKSLLDACQKLGFFFLDLTGDELGESITADIDAIFGASKEIMNLPPEVKRKYKEDPPHSFLGCVLLGLNPTVAIIA